MGHSPSRRKTGNTRKAYTGTVALVATATLPTGCGSATGKPTGGHNGKEHGTDAEAWTALKHLSGHLRSGPGVSVRSGSEA